ncbi:MAG: hypothetical protein ACR2KX_01770, partial [Chitinophagaceae bacterium]
VVASFDWLRIFVCSNDSVKENNIGIFLLSEKKHQSPNKRLAAAGVDVEAIGCKSLSEMVSAAKQSQAKILSSTFKQKPSCSSGRDVIKYPACSNT